MVELRDVVLWEVKFMVLEIIRPRRQSFK